MAEGRMMERIRQFVARHDRLMSGLLIVLVLSLAAHQFVTSAIGTLTPWKGGGFGMYTAPHGTTHRATFLLIDGHPLRLSPPDPALLDWAALGDPDAQAYLDRMIAEAAAMRTYPRDVAADALMAKAARVVWEKPLFSGAKDIGNRPASAMVVTVIEVAWRPSQGLIDSRVVFSKAGQ